MDILMDLLVAILFVWVIIITAVVAIMATMLATMLIRKNGLTDIDVTNLMMVETCIFAGALVLVILLVGGGL